MARQRRTQGEGSVFQHVDNGSGAARWRGYVTLATGQRRYVSGRTKIETIREVARVRRLVEQGLPIPNDRLTVKEFLVDWMAREGRTLRATSKRRYDQILRDHVIPDLGKHKLVRLLPDHLDDLYAKQLAAGLSAHSVGLTHAVLHAALERAYRWGKAPRNVADLVTPPERPRTEADALSPAEARQFLQASAGNPFEAVFVLALTTGLRRGELLGLRWSRVDLEAGTLRVDATLLASQATPLFGEPKTESSKRTVILGRHAVKSLAAHRARQVQERLKVEKWTEYDLVFANTSGGPIAPGTLGRRWDALLQAAGLRHVKFHSTRHTAATIGKDAGVHGKDMADRLGHTDLLMTLGRYTHTGDDARKLAADRIDASLFRAASSS